MPRADIGAGSLTPMPREEGSSGDEDKDETGTKTPPSFTEGEKAKP
jgi:hypothetical protein